MNKFCKNHYLIAMLVLLVSCSKQYTLKNNGATISITEDDPFTISLDGDANSKFSWKLESKPEFTKLEEPIVKTINGTTETYTFNFKAISDGEEFIRILYTDGNEIKKSFEIYVIVGEIGLIETD